MSLNPPRGLIVDLITPLKQGRGLDITGLQNQIQRVLPYADALFVGGPVGGEGLNIDTELRLELVNYVLSMVHGKCPLFIWITCPNSEETRSFILRVNEIVNNTEGNHLIFFVDTSLYYHSNRGLVAHYREISQLVSYPFILHNDPGLVAELRIPFKRKNIRTNILKDLSSIESICGMIFTGSLDRVRNYEKAVKGEKGFRIYDGDESRFLQHPSLSGVLSIGANISPKAWYRVTHSSIDPGEGDHLYPDQLRQIWEYGRFLQHTISFYGLDPVYVIKHVLCDQGILEEPFTTHKPNTELSDKLNSLKQLLMKNRQYL
jgi:dihydrodipicolinate synthase/N-acetylneuraminate lyase